MKRRRRINKSKYTINSHILKVASRIRVEYCFSSSLPASLQECLREGNVKDVDQLTSKDFSTETFPRNKTCLQGLGVPLMYTYNMLS